MTTPGDSHTIPHPGEEGKTKHPDRSLATTTGHLDLLLTLFRSPPLFDPEAVGLEQGKGQKKDWIPTSGTPHWGPQTAKLGKKAAPIRDFEVFILKNLDKKRLKSYIFSRNARKTLTYSFERRA